MCVCVCVGGGGGGEYARARACEFVCMCGGGGCARLYMLIYIACILNLLLLLLLLLLLSSSFFFFFFFFLLAYLLLVRLTSSSVNDHRLRSCPLLSFLVHAGLYCCFHSPQNSDMGYRIFNELDSGEIKSQGGCKAKQARNSHPCIW